MRGLCVRRRGRGCCRPHRRRPGPLRAGGMRSVWRPAGALRGLPCGVPTPLVGAGGSHRPSASRCPGATSWALLATLCCPDVAPVTRRSRCFHHPLARPTAIDWGHWQPHGHQRGGTSGVGLGAAAFLVPSLEAGRGHETLQRTCRGRLFPSDMGCGQVVFRTIQNQAPPPPQTKVTIEGNNEIYHRENLIGATLHTLSGPPPPSSPLKRRPGCGLSVPQAATVGRRRVQGPLLPVKAGHGLVATRPPPGGGWGLGSEGVRGQTHVCVPKTRFRAL